MDAATQIGDKPGITNQRIRIHTRGHPKQLTSEIQTGRIEDMANQ